MTGWELKLWRKGMYWSREKAARELGICLRTLHDWENAKEVSHLTELATIALSTNQLLPDWRKHPRKHPRESMLTMLESLHKIEKK
ncbi:helix-turn-helix transcriptional regulator [Pectobacterium carotovorum]|nr:helix-turn-helix transcriptional regulator [Pectobacterium carotovorum]MDX6917842.1 helix-turn-helix transcriptional regulator [Pectobacterium carotovorum]